MEFEKSSLFIWRGRILYAGLEGYTSEPHRHYAASLLLGLDEPVVLATDFAGAAAGERGGTREFARCWLLGPNLHHQSIVAGRVAVIQLDPDSARFAAMADRLGSAGYCRLDAELADVRITGEFAKLFLDGVDCEFAGELYAEFLNRLFGSNPETQTASASPRLEARIAACIARLQAELPDQVSVGELAAEVGLSEDRFMHVFKAQMGLPVRRYLLWLRLHRAARLMKAGVTLTEAAHGAGFADSAHMSRTFKENFGVPPSGFLSPVRGNVRVFVCED